MSGNAEQRYSIQQGHCLDNATQMGHDELSTLTCYVTQKGYLSAGLVHVGVFLLYKLNLFLYCTVLTKTVRVLFLFF